MNSQSIYTDLAVEANNLAVQRTGGQVEGVEVEEDQIGETAVTRVEVKTEAAGRSLGKAPGLYITIESTKLREGDRQVQEKVSQILAEELEQMINFQALAPPLKDPTIFVVGLGNWNATPDSLGPQTLHHIMVTRHLFGSGPPELQGQMRPVCTLAPGVLGLTGIETAEIIKAVVDQIAPDMILAIDALAARNTERLSTTIQICNTGIQPGSGLGQKRFGITQKDMGIPVIALGVPTVINAVTIVRDAFDTVRARSGENPSPNTSPNAAFPEPGAVENAVRDVLNPYMGNLFVAPKGIDELIQNVSKVIAGGINVALHQGMGIEDVTRYL